MKRLPRDERGILMPWTAVTLPLLLMMLGAASDLGLAMATRAGLQTMADAAAAAGAAQGERWLAATVERDCQATHTYWVEPWYHCLMRDPETGQCSEGHWHDGYWSSYTYRFADPNPPAVGRIKKADFIDRGGWRDYAWNGNHNGDPASCTPSGYTIDKQWSEFPRPDTENVTEATGWQNGVFLPAGVTPRLDLGVEEKSASVAGAPDAVTVAASAVVPTHFLRIVGIKEIPVRTLGRAYTRPSN